MTTSDALETLYSRGVELLNLHQPAAAVDVLRQGLVMDPGNADFHHVMGLALAALGQRAAALASYDAAIRIDPYMAVIYLNRGVTLHEMGRLTEALDNFTHSITLEPNNPIAHANKATILSEMRRPAEAVASLDRALQLKPTYPFLRGLRLLNKMVTCDWIGVDHDFAQLLQRAERGEQVTAPWVLVGLADKPALQRKIAEAWAESRPARDALGPVGTYPHHTRIKLGYYSADFYRHATTYLIAELFERHDRSKFEVIAFSFGAQTGDDMQQRLIAGCDRFIDVRMRSEPEIAALSRELEIDIAIDLKGLTQGHRLDIFAHRAAPIQVSYLGYPSTMGVPYMDYLVADDVVIPAVARDFYTERVVALPSSYQVNDRKRRISDRTFSRTELGLPETGFVFCSFNNNFKITPEMFDIWMRILLAVDGSVLWLIEDNGAAARNLRREADRRGVAGDRLVFAGRIAPDEHLSRHRLADLFLDTLPCNAHTTASDALWVGVPVLTCPGEGLAARVAASLVKAMDLPELIAPTLKDYEEIAVALALNPGRLRTLKEKMSRNRLTTPLFDTDLFARNIEAAYTQMMANLPKA